MITFKFDCEHWVAGAARFQAQFGSTAAKRWESALDSAYEKSQQIVHVVTGNLKASGRKEIIMLGDELIGSVVYGGGVVDYAGIEYERGGSHDFLTPAFVQVQDQFGPALIGAYEEVMETWR